MSNTATEPDARRWNAFVCSDCRAIFRVPARHPGLGVVCPACERMLRLPQASDGLSGFAHDSKSDVEARSEIRQNTVVNQSPIKTQDTETPSASSVDHDVPVQELRRRKKSKTEHYVDAETEWNQGVDKKMLRFDKPRAPWWMIAAIAVLSLLLVIVVTLLLTNTSPQPKVAMPTIVPEVISKDPVVKPLAKQNIDLPKIEKLAKLYINAQSVDELLLHVRHLPGIEQKIREYYQRVPYASAGFSKFDDESIFTDEHGVVIVNFQSKNFESKQLFMRKDGTDYLIDWESSVGWSAMSVEELKSTKPTKAVEVRVTIAPELYYNFDFPPSEEAHWQSYRLIFADGESILHGYVEKATSLDNQLRLAPDEKSRQMVLLIKYRENAKSNDQVVIEQIVTDGWVK